MKKNYFRLFLLGVLLLAFGTISFGQRTQPKKPKIYKTIVSEDFQKTTVIKSNPVRKKRAKKWRKRCRYVYYRRNGRLRRVYRCFKR